MAGIPHATNAGYTIHGCRCEGCVEAHRVYHRYYARQRAGREIPEAQGLSEIATTGISIDELDLWTAWAEHLGISRAAMIRRYVNEGIELYQALERQEQRERRTPLIDHGG
jgi:hypothetical protein